MNRSARRRPYGRRKPASQAWWLPALLVTLAMLGVAAQETEGEAEGESEGEAEPQTFYVDGTFTGTSDGSIEAPYSMIADALAITELGRGDTVVVRPGLYAESVEVGEETTLISEEGAHETYVLGDPDVTGEVDPADALIKLEDLAVLRGFSIGETRGLAVRVPVNARVEVTNCIIYQSDTGLRAELDAELYCANNTFYNNGTGLQVEGGGHAAPLANNIFAQNDLAVRVLKAGRVQSAYNSFHANDREYDGADPGASDMPGNPLFVNPDLLNFHLRLVSNLRNAGDPAPEFNDRDGTRNDVGSDGGPHGALDILLPQVFVTAEPRSLAGAPPFPIFLDAGASTDAWGIALWEWDFDALDGITTDGIGTEPAPIFQDPGGFLVTLRVTDNSSNVGEAKFNVWVGDAPRVTRMAATPTVGPPPLTVAFSADVSTADGSTPAYEWDFDNDGIVDSMNPNPQHTFPADTEAGVLRPVLTLTDGAGVYSQVQPPPITISTYPVLESVRLGAGEPAELAVQDPDSPLDGMNVIIPTNALNQPMTLALSEVPTNVAPLLPEGELVALFTLSPSGARFARPITVRVPLDDAQTRAADVQLYFFDVAEQNWRKDGLSNLRIVEGTTREIAFDTAHFTTFAVLKTPRPSPEPPEKTDLFGCAAASAKASPRAAGDALVIALTMLALAFILRRASRGRYSVRPWTSTSM